MVLASTHKTMELEGNLSSFQLPEVLKFLAMGQMTGRLELGHAQRSMVLLVKEGRLAGSLSEDRDEKIGQLLVHGGHLARRQLEEALETLRANPQQANLGRLLVRRSVVAAEQVRNALELHVKEELWDAFSWNQGSFKFEHGPLTAGEEPLGLEIEPLIEEGLRRMEQWRLIERNLGRNDDVYRINPSPTFPLDPPLQATEWRVLALMNGRLSVQGLICQSGLGKFETLSVLDRLLTHQLVELVERRTGSVPPRPSATQAVHDPAPITEEEDPSTGRRGLFGRRRRPAAAIEPTPVTEPAPTGAPAGCHRTAVAFGCAVVNYLAERLALQRKDPSSRLLASEDWRLALVQHPRADLVRLEAGRLNPSLFERYAELAGGRPQALAACCEETMAALGSLAAALAHQAAEAGAASAREWAAGQTGRLVDHAEVAWPPDFSARGWTAHWLAQLD